MDDFNPKRVESHAFRGFSFVQEDFELPARPVSPIGFTFVLIASKHVLRRIGN